MSRSESTGSAGEGRAAAETAPETESRKIDRDFVRRIVRLRS